MLMPICFLSITKVALYGIPIAYRTVGCSDLFVGIEGGIKIVTQINCSLLTVNQERIFGLDREGVVALHIGEDCRENIQILSET